MKLPPLNGGVNLYDTPTEVADNQLTACENVWWHKGALRTRPGYTEAWEHIGTNVRNTQIISDREMLLTGLQSTGGKHRLEAFLMDLSGAAQRIGIKGSDQVYGGADQTVLGFRAPTKGKNEWFFLLSGGTVMQGSTEDTLDIVDPYIPTVLINGYGDEGHDDYSIAAGDMYQDYNMLTRAYKATFTTDGVSTRFHLPEVDVGEKPEENHMYGHIRITLADGERVESDIIRQNDVTNYAYANFDNITGEQIGNAVYTDVRITVALNVATGMLTIHINALVPAQPGEGVEEGATEAVQGIALPRICDNNIEVTAYRSHQHDEKKEMICKMTRCVWFGGSRNGITGGSRLFVCGNPDEPNLLHWSGIEHPLYFPERNYNRIGDASQAITAFGKQGELLIIFKEHQMYAAQYEAADETDYEFAKDGGVPITTYMAQFPVTPLNDGIGCDCPDTVRLVNNRLVWANSNGHVYLLTDTNQFSERNVRDISRNVTADMAAQGEALKTAVAGEYEGYYILAAGARVYLLDTQSSAFSSFSYYSSEDGARKVLPWYIWQMPFAIREMLSDGKRLLFTTDAANKVLELGGNTDGSQPISGHFATKAFDFGMSDRTKSVGQLYMGVEMDPDGHLALTYTSEKGNRRDPYEMDGGELATTGMEGCRRYLRFTPQMNLVQTFGLQADISGAVAVDGITIKVKQQGVVR